MRSISANRYIFFAVLMGLLLSFLTLFFAFKTHERETHYLQTLVDKESYNTARDLHGVIVEKIKVLERMAKRWESSKGINKKNWVEDAKQIIQHHPGFQAIEWVDNKHIVRWVVPEIGNESALNLNLSFEKRRNEALERAKNIRQTFMTKSITLIQGGKGFLVFVPIFIDNKFNGFILGVFRVKQIIQPLISAETSKGYEFAILEDKIPIYHNQDFNIRKISSWHKETVINFNQYTWTLLVWPSERLLASIKKSTATYILVIGLIITALVAFLLFILAVLKRSSESTESQNKDLKILEEKNRHILDSAAEGIFGLDDEGKTTFINPAAERMLGYTSEHLIGETIHDIIHFEHENGDPYPFKDCPIYESFLTNRVRRIDTDVFITRDGRKIPVEYISTPITTNKEIIGVVVTFNDISERKKTEEHLNRKITEVNLIQQSTYTISEGSNFNDILRQCLSLICVSLGWPVGHAYIPNKDSSLLESSKIWFIKDNLDIKDFCNITEDTTFKQGIGLPGRIWLSKKPAWIEDIQKDDNFPRAKLCRDLNLHSAVGFPIYLGKDLIAVMEFFTNKLIQQDEGLLNTFNVLGSQISQVWEKKYNEDSVKLSEEKYRALIETANEAIIIIDAKGLILECNDSLTSILGYTASEIIGRSVADLMLKTSMNKENDFFEINFVSDSSSTPGGRREIKAKHKNGTIIDILISINKIIVSDEIQYVGILHDISKEKEAQENLEKMAHYDFLTGLHNRVSFQTILSETIKREERNNNIFALFYLDLDGFKKVNDTLGHDTGDQVLKEVAQRLNTILREYDTIARIGGDEFIIIVQDISTEENIQRVAKKILLHLSEPYIASNSDIHITVSIGVAVFPTDGRTPEALIKNADKALYQVKNDKRNNYALFSPFRITRNPETSNPRN